MALPTGIPTVTVTGRYLTPDGKPLTGAIVFRPTAETITFGGDDVVLAGPVRATLDETGSFSVTLPATDADGMNPTGWNYEVSEQLATVKAWRTYAILLPQENPAADLADLAPTDPLTPEYVAVRGDSAYEVAVANGFVGTEEEWLASLVGPKGDPGEGSVDSVNGDVGPEVVLDAADVGAVATTGDESVSGRKTFLDPVTVRSALAEALLTIEQTDTAATAGVFKLIGGNADNAVFLGRGQEHVANAWAIRANGTFEIGDGANGRDIVLTRIDVNEVSWTTNVRCTIAAPTHVSHLTRKDYVDGLDSGSVKLNEPQTITANKKLEGAVAGDEVLSTHVTGDGFARWELSDEGVMEWGSGSASRDVSWYRPSAGQLNTSGQVGIDAPAPTDAAHATRKDYVDAGAVKNTWTPQALGFQAWSMDPSAVMYRETSPPGSQHPVGRTLFCGMNITQGTDVNNVVIWARGWAGSSLAPDEEFYAAIYDETGNRVADSGLITVLPGAGQITGSSAAAQSNHSGAVPVPLLSTATLTPGRYWAAFLHSAGAANNFYYMPVEGRAPTPPANFFLAPAFQRFWYLDGQTSTPASVDPTTGLTESTDAAPADVAIMALALL